jgi:hypothetical protein
VLLFDIEIYRSLGVSAIDMMIVFNRMCLSFNRISRSWMMVDLRSVHLEVVVYFLVRKSDIFRVSLNDLNQIS